MQKAIIEGLNTGEDKGTTIEADYFKIDVNNTTNYIYVSNNILHINTKEPTKESIENNSTKTNKNETGLNLFILIPFAIFVFGYSIISIYLAWDRKNIYTDEKNKIIVEEINNKKQELEDLEHKLYKK